ncbi:hypothetical protein LZC95_42365 [Pendulispora brunnea]|uniref:Dickkopf N-terminal cysteine-rich domain-containing protein n=1 Tax=Pendulispora brunnea TaxID=2905690 RepID=A0ABZ2K6T5_9BACT
MSSPSPREKRFALCAALAAVVAAVAVGCAATGSVSDMGGNGSDPGSFGPPPYALPDSADGGDGAAAVQRGNALCHAEAFACYPDGTRSDTCNDDAGPSDSTEDAGVPPPPQDKLACRVRSGGTTCLPAGKGEANQACTKAADCAAGFECVASGTQGFCRHYCCDGRTSCTDKNAFCDIQMTKDAKESVAVPVCMPVRQCDLLEVNRQCSLLDEDCSIVDENEGTTSCVTVGPARVGEDCSSTHCGRGLACLGQSGQRKCYQLCKKNDPSACAPNERCVGSAPLFQDSNIGTCSSR